MAGNVCTGHAAGVGSAHVPMRLCAWVQACASTASRPPAHCLSLSSVRQSVVLSPATFSSPLPPSRLLRVSRTSIYHSLPPPVHTSITERALLLLYTPFGLLCLENASSVPHPYPPHASHLDTRPGACRHLGTYPRIPTASQTSRQDDPNSVALTFNPFSRPHRRHPRWTRNSTCLSSSSCRPRQRPPSGRCVCVRALRAADLGYSDFIDDAHHRGHDL